MRARELLSSTVISLISLAAAAAAMASAATPAETPAATPAGSARYIVQAANLRSARRDIGRVGARAQQNLEIINAASAYLDPRQLARLRKISGVHVFEDRLLTTEGTGLLGLLSPVTSPVVTALSAVTTPSDGNGELLPTLLYQTNYPSRVGADTLQQGGITGKGVTIAVLDSGLWQDPLQNYTSRLLATINVVNGGSGPVTGDAYGHGTHVTSIAAGGAMNVSGSYLSIAPQANVVEVQAFDGTGGARYADVISGLNWIVANKKKYNIRVLNLSFGATPESYYWNDPVDQAVMAAWQAGIVVVVAAGNEGPTPMTIEVPGNVPYVITTGALTDNYTPSNPADDRLASFSSAGPTFEGFVKPEVLAPGGHIVASMPSSSYLANIDPGSMILTEQMFTMSGTSMAAAVTTGVVALMLQSDPALTPDQVKCRLLASAAPAVTSSGTLAYSVFQQGAGLINAVSAVNSSAANCANVGLNIGADLAGTEHFGGPANQAANGDYYIMNMTGPTWSTAPQAADGYSWDQGYAFDQGYSWSQGYLWSQGYAWTQGYVWTNSYAWARSYTWAQSYAWSRSVPWWNSSKSPAGVATPASIENWVPNQ
jgi:subtilisin family serine protease